MQFYCQGKDAMYRSTEISIWQYWPCANSTVNSKHIYYVRLKPGGTIGLYDVVILLHYFYGNILINVR